MRKLIRMVSHLLLCLPLNVLSNPDTTGINFVEDLTWNQIKQKAGKENKYIFVDCYTTWCGPCKRMDKEVFQNDSVGRFMNEKFISVKIQMDSTAKDGPDIQKMYADARYFASNYNITVYPTFLFFNPNGDLVYKDVGFRIALEFVKVGIKALDDRNLRYYTRLDDFKKGKRADPDLYDLANYSWSLGNRDLAKEIGEEYIARVDRQQLLEKSKILFVLKVANNKILADSLAAVYKSKYLDTLNDNDLFKWENVNFIEQFLYLINSKDKFFHFCYQRPRLADSLTAFPGWSKLVVDQTITREELESKLLRKNSAYIANSDWNELEINIQKKYPAINAHRLVLDYKIVYYKMLKAWPLYTQLLIKRVDKYGPYGEFPDVDFNLNNHAWDIFLHSNNANELEKALSWSEKAVDLVLKSKDQSNLANWMDTKANILYKLGRKGEAIDLEMKVVELDPNSLQFANNLQKMKTGQETWTE